MTITATQLKEIRQEFAALKPASVTLDGNRTMSVKEAVFILAPTLEPDRSQTAAGRTKGKEARHTPTASETRTTLQLHYF